MICYESNIVRRPSIIRKIDIKNAKTVEKKVLEIDPDRIKVGEAIIYKVPSWFGFKNECFAILNIDGKRLIVEQLKRKVTGKTRKREQIKR